MYILRLALLDELDKLVYFDSKVNLTAWSYIDYYNSYLNEDNYIYVLELDQKIYACCVWGKIEYDAEILQLWVSKPYQGVGIGHMFLKKIIELLRDQFFIKKVFLELRENNLLAQKLYLKNGFKVIGKRKNYYIVDNIYIDAILMVNNIKEINFV
jgi:ribosomal-protein-alanine N-acetyltransferase